MHPTAKKCVQWAVGLLLLGALVLAYGTEAYVGLADAAGANAAIGLEVVDFIVTLLRSALFPMGAVLIGAAVVIQALAGSTAGDVAQYEQVDRSRQN